MKRAIRQLRNTDRHTVYDNQWAMLATGWRTKRISHTDAYHSLLLNRTDFPGNDDQPYRDEPQAQRDATILAIHTVNDDNPSKLNRSFCLCHFPITRMGQSYRNPYPRL